MLRIYDPDSKYNAIIQPRRVGTLFEQFLAVGLFLADERRHDDREAAWVDAIADSQRGTSTDFGRSA